MDEDECHQAEDGRLLAITVSNIYANQSGPKVYSGWAGRGSINAIGVERMMNATSAVLCIVRSVEQEFS
jgi:hypothetical protein